jgi:hypothetical protein
MASSSSSLQSGEKAAKEKSTRKFWEKDNLTPDSPSSLDVLVEWLSDVDNYTRWRGGRDAPGCASKEVLLGEIRDRLRKAGLDREKQAIRNKIQDIETQFKAAVEWKNHTGQGVKKESDLRREILKRCPLYYHLESVMLDRPHVNPLCDFESTATQHEIFDIDGSPQSTDETDAERSPASSSAHLSPPNSTESNNSDSTSPSLRKRTPRSLTPIKRPSKKQRSSQNDYLPSLLSSLEGIRAVMERKNDLTEKKLQLQERKLNAILEKGSNSQE